MGFCLGKFPLRARSPSPARRDNSKAILGSIESKFRAKNSSRSVKGRRIMVVVDSSREAKAALQWALSHTVQSYDTIVLLDVLTKKSSTHGAKDPRSRALLHAMKIFCKARKPEVEVELSLVEGKERGPTIVEEAERQQVSLLVLGRKKRSIAWRSLMVWTRRWTKKGRGAVDHCVQNASCMTLAVRAKSRRSGGYLITTRHHRNFWLLA